MAPTMEAGPEAMTPPPTTTPTKILLGKYELGRLLGCGTFAKVYYARSIVDGIRVAIKAIDKSMITDASMEARILREVDVMRRLRHPNIIKLHEVMATKSKIYLVMEYAKGGELYSRVWQRGPLKETVARHLFWQLISALQYCHSNGVAHRDLKLQNILLDHDGNVKVSDFGLSALPDQLKDGLLHTACGTPAYTAPEVVQRKGYDGAKADAWSCGVILYVLLAGSLPFDDFNLAVMYMKMKKSKFEFPRWFSLPVRNVITQLLDPNPETRMTIKNLMEAGWFKKPFQSKCKEYFLHMPDQMSKPNPSMPPKDGELDSGCDAAVMNAFDIISLSSGLDLSGLFEVGRKAEKKFMTTSSAVKIIERVEEVGGKMGYEVNWRKGGTISLLKDQIVLSIEILEVASTILLVELKVKGISGIDFEKLYWGNLKTGLEDLVFAWNNDGIDSI